MVKRLSINRLMKESPSLMLYKHSSLRVAGNSVDLDRVVVDDSLPPDMIYMLDRNAYKRQDYRGYIIRLRDIEELDSVGWDTGL